MTVLVEILGRIATSLIPTFLGRTFGRERLKVICFWNHVVNGDGAGTFLALFVKIINPGKDPIYFERIEAVASDGATYFPLFFGVTAGTEIPAKRNIVGTIPCGHITSKAPKELRIYDSTERRHSFRGRKLRQLILGLAAERERLEKLGFAVHPTSPRPA